MIENRPPNIPQRYANQATHARHAVHARTFFLSDFVSIENKGSKLLIPKLDVAGSIPVARSIFLVNSKIQFSKVLILGERPRKFSLARECQTLEMRLTTGFKCVGEGIT